jgi:hypothetical protein
VAETTHGLITDQDVTRWYEAFEAASGVPLAEEERTDSGEVREALEAVAPGLRARWVAEALEEAAGHPTATLWDDLIKRGVPAVSVTDLHALAAEYRDGTR